MREVLRERRLVNEASPRPQHAGDLAERVGGAGPATADMVAGAEVDDEIEGRVFEGERPEVALEHGRADAERAHTVPGDRGERGVEIHPDQRRGREPLREDGEGDAATAPHLEDASAERRAEGAEEERDLEPRVQSVAGLDVPERLVLGG